MKNLLANILGIAEKDDFMKKSVKIFISVIVSVAVVFLSVCGYFAYLYYHGTTTEVSSIGEVEEYGAEDFFPADYKNYDNVTFLKNNKWIFIFESNTISMKIKDSEKFESLKADIIKKYSEKDFLGNEPVVYKSIVIRAVTVGDRAYPQQIGFIGISEEKEEIYYVWFCDPDLDYIDDYEDFVVDNFRQIV